MNPIVAENQLPGNPQTEWDISSIGDVNIQGYSTDISGNVGETMSFKIDDVLAVPYRLDIYRMGYYGGMGARKVATVPSTQTSRVHQPAPLTNASTALVDAGNWSVTASWQIPSTAVSGIYFARVVREDTGGASRIVFVVRDDNSHSDLLFQTSDSTWAAYNDYGNQSLYEGSSTIAPGRAVKVSYNRPLTLDDRPGGFGTYNSPFHSEYPMVRFLERNGYNVSYSTNVDTERRGAEILEHKAFLSIGHDEYWSAGMRTNVEAARDAGVNIAFFSGNEVFWKVRWENSTDASGTPYRTLVTYKESKDNAKTDPNPAWTGTWRDNRFSPPSDGGRPENSLTGTMYMDDRTSTDIGLSMQVPAEFSGLRFWRNTSVAALQPGQVVTVGDRIVGYEVDEDVDNGFRPAGLLRMSKTTFDTQYRVSVPWGTVVAPGTSTHTITLYRAASGALVFGAGTVQWVWGLDGQHNDGAGTADPAMQQATVNLLADMGAQPGTLQSDLIKQSMSTDLIGPSSTVTAPTPGTNVTAATPVTVTGTASDTGGGAVAAVEVSTDGGKTWHPATGRNTWTYTWTPDVPGPTRILSRAVDDSANIGQVSAGVTVTVNLPPTSSTGLVAAYNFNAGTGTTVANQVGASNTGTITNATWTTQGAFGSNALSFNGTNAWVTVPDSASLDLTNGMTLEAWVKPADISRYTTVIMKENSVNLAYALYGSDGANRPPVTWISNGLDYSATGPANAALNQWMHLAATYDGNALNLYVNGKLANTDISNGKPITVTAGALRIGGNSIWGEYFQGIIDEVRVYNRSLNAGEILADMSTPVGGVVETTVPTVSVTAPVGGTTVSNVATLTANAADNLYVAGVQFLLNGQPIGDEDLTAPYTLAWDSRKVANGNYVLTAKARDAAGNTTTSLPVNITVGNAADVIAPAITLNNPFTNDVVSGTSVLWAVPSDNIGVTGVQFKVNGANVGPLVTSAPYRFLWDASATGSGSATVTAVAFDAAGNQTAANVFVTVDASPPVVTGFTPANGATSVSSGVRPTATFSEAVVPGSASFQVRDPSGNVLAGSLAYDDVTHTVTFIPGASLSLGTTYTVTLGSTRDLLGNAMTNNVVWSFTTDTTIPRATLWPSTAVPSNPATTDGASVELGLKFTSDLGGYIKGVRFYKGTGNTGTHVAHLWSATGQLLATGTFTNETATGWQEATFTTPVQITPNTTYTASYYAPVGHYPADPSYFTSPRNSAPLHGVDGLFVYGSGGGFPVNSFNATNYWVDVVFGTTQNDITPPTLSSSSPAANAAGIATTAKVTATFSEAVVASTILFELRDGANNLVPTTVSYDVVTQTMTAAPNSLLSSNTNYIARLSGARDSAGNVMAPVTWNFSTLPPDTTAPTASNVTPGPGQAAVAPKATVAVTFNEPVKPSTISLNVLNLTDNIAMTSSVLYDSATNTATFLPVAPAGAPAGCCGQCTHCPLKTATQYRATLSGVQDLSGNVMPDMTWTFTTDDLITGASLWGGTAVPATASSADTSAIEVGMKFQTVETGYITGLRFYKGAANTGVHVGHLWSGAGLPLASATFTNESASGWQQVNFSMPVLIQAGTTYVASYFAPDGGYAISDGYFNAAGFSSGVLVAPGSTQVGGNGVFFYGSGGAFPTQSFNGTNYWVDVVYANTLATVLQYSPAPGTAVAVDANMTATFSLAVQPASITFTLLDAQNNVLPGSVTYDAATNKATFDPTAPLAPSSTYTVTVTAMDVYNNVSEPTTWSFLTVAGPDTVAPTVTGRTPADASTGNSRGVTPTVTFSETIQPGTLAITLRDQSGTAVPAAVTYDAPTRTATVAPNAVLASNTTYTVTVTNAQDLAGNALASGGSWTFTTGTVTGPVIEGASIWGPTATPATASASETLTIELGVKFKADYDGYITGIRFYKGATNTGTHVGKLWTSTGTLLSSATFNNETASGWQEVKFAAAVPIAAGITYVASYLAPSGGYAVSGGYFTGAGTDNGALHALSSAAAGGNGLFLYGGGFPTQSFNATNYWVDVAYATVIDTDAPTVVSKAPALGATGVASGVTPSVTFSEAVQAGSISFVLSDSDGYAVPATVAYNVATRTATLTPLSPLFGPVTYTATVSGAKDVAGNTMAPVTWTFTTVAVAVPAIQGATLWAPSMTPAITSANDGSSVELGVKVRAEYDGYILGLRFYKGAGNIGAHVGHLWSSSGTLLATGTFTNETASGWQQVNFDAPVSITRGATYVASYYAPNGGYAVTAGYFAGGGTDSGALHALSNGAPGGNGVFATGTGFPNQTFNASNYWVDVVYTTVADSTPPTVTGKTPADGATAVPVSSALTVTFGEAVRPESITFALRNAAGEDIPGTLSYDGTTRVATFTPSGLLSGLSTYTATVTGARDAFGNTIAAPVSWSFTTASVPVPTIQGVSLFPASATPATASANDGSSVELGVKFRADYNGYVTGIRFYKGSTNTGVHVGHLWTSSGTLLATATFGNETASGWQQVNFDAPVAISAGTTYVASYLAPSGRYAVTGGYFATPVDTGALHAPGGATANGVYRYGNGAFPNQSYNATNYWVDVVYSTVLDSTAPTVTGKTPAAGATGVAVGAAVTVTFSETVQPGTIGFVLRDSLNNVVPSSVTYNDTTRTATLTPTGVLNPGETFTATVSGALDVTGNALAAPTTWSFTTANTSIRQTTAADFNAGTGTGTQVTSTGGGEVQLAATVALSDDFAAALGSAWTTSSWAGSGGGPASVTVSGGILSVLGAQVNSTATFSNKPLEAVVSFGAASYQHFGLATSLSVVAGQYWAMFSTMNTTGTLFARVNNNGTQTDVNLGARPTGFHLYRIQPVTGGFQFYVDNVLKTTINGAFPGTVALRVAASAFSGAPQPALQVDSLNVSSYGTTGTFVSKVLDAGTTVHWGPVAWTATVPPGTSLVVETRTGNTANPDGTWSAYAVATNGGAIGNPNGRYIQYRLTLTSSDGTSTPIILDLLMNWT